MHVRSLCLKCFRCLRRMFQVFHLDLAYVAMLYPHFKLIFQVFHMFHTYVASVSSGCFKSRSERTHVAIMALVAGGQRPAVATCCYWRRRRGSPCGPLSVTPSVLHRKSFTKTDHEHHVYVLMHVIECVDQFS